MTSDSDSLAANPFRIETTTTSAATIVTFSGAITETARFQTFSGGPISVLALNLHSVTYINSAGILQWLAWMTHFRKRHPKARIDVLGCPRMFVDQLNSVRNLISPPFTVQSMFVPFFCDNCNVGYDQLLVQKDHFTYQRGTKPTIKLPQVPCPTCRQPMAPDVIENHYFRFLELAG
jgi:hypothetical protein